MKKLALIAVLTTPILACSGSNDAGFSDGGSSGSFVGSSGNSQGGGNGDVTIYANTDDSLYSLSPATNAVSLIGPFCGVGGASGDSVITDVAVNAEGDVYVNSETVLYKAQLPAKTGTVQLTSVATIAGGGAKFYALAFAPAGLLGSGETLVGGDGNGELWSIDPTSGATKDLGSFGADPSKSGHVLALSGDIVFYAGSNGMPTGLATIRSCSSGGTSCSTTDDYLAGIDVGALQSAFASGKPAASLLAGIYGGGTGSDGAGTGEGELFGLGAWEGNVYGFKRGSSGGSGSSAAGLYSINPSTGVASLAAGNISVQNGWSGAGVTTKVTVTVPGPPPK